MVAIHFQRMGGISFFQITQGVPISCCGLNFWIFCDLQPPAPAVLPDNTNQVDITPDTGLYAGAGEKLDRVVSVHGQPKRGTHSRIVIQLIAFHAFYRRAPAVIVRPA